MAAITQVQILVTANDSLFFFVSGLLEFYFVYRVQIPPGLSLMSDVLKKAGGTLIPLSTLVTPLAPQMRSPQLPSNPLTSVERQGATERCMDVHHSSANVDSILCSKS